MSPRHYFKFYHSSPFILTRQINDDDDDDDDEIPSAARKRKSAISMFVYLVFLVCYLPQYFVGVTRLIEYRSVTSRYHGSDLTGSKQ